MAQEITGNVGGIPLLVGALLIFIASQVGSRLMRTWADVPGIRAVLSWIPVAIATGVAIFLRRPDLALAIIFSTSIAVLSLMQGTLALISPQADSPAGPRRFWPFVLPAALLTLLAGFAGDFTIIHAAIFVAEGTILLAAWPEMNRQGDSHVAGANRLIKINIPNVALCIILAAGGAGAAVSGAVAIAKHFPVPQGTGIATLMAPLLVLPLLTGASSLAHENRGWVATSAGVGLVLLNLCLLLPIIILSWQKMTGNLLVFSILTWRVDNVVLILLAFILYPVSMGRWRMGRSEGMTLIGFYLAYVLMEIAVGLRS